MFGKVRAELRHVELVENLDRVVADEEEDREDEDLSHRNPEPEVVFQP